jgi:hypothetical protein
MLGLKYQPDFYQRKNKSMVNFSNSGEKWIADRKIVI